MLSPHMQKYLESLTALHSAELQAQGSRELGRTVRREPVTTEHPLVRTNPVTGWKSLFFNPGFVTKIVGVPKTESDHIIGLLNEIVATSPEIQARFQWRAGDVAFWDNRVTVSLRIPLPPLLTCQTVKLTWRVEPFRDIWLCTAPETCSEGCCACRTTVSRPAESVSGRGAE